MTRTKDIEKIAELGLLAIKDDLAEYKGKWANLYIYKTGSMLGDLRFNTAHEADSNAGILREGSTGYVRGLCGSKHKRCDLLSHLPIPVKP